MIDNDFIIEVLIFARLYTAIVKTFNKSDNYLSRIEIAGLRVSLKYDFIKDHLTKVTFPFSVTTKHSSIANSM